MIKSFFANRRWALWAYGAGLFLIASLYIQVQFTVLINTWYGGFYDMLQSPQGHDILEFWTQLFGLTVADANFLWMTLPMPSSFMGIALPYVVLATFTSYITRLYAFRWRQAITEDYIPRWRNVAAEIEGASQRIQEDTARFAHIVQGLGLASIRGLMTLIAFLPILWTLSSKVDIPVIKDIPGSLVWASLIISLGGMFISWFVGWFLPGLEYNNQKVEAAFRKELVLGEDDKLRHGRPDTLLELFTGIRFNYHRLYLHYGYFDMWYNLFGQITSLTPLLLIGPSMMVGAVTFGTFQQVANAYGRVDSAFAIVLDNWTTLTELRSIWKRLNEFERNLDRHNTGSDVALTV